MAAEIAARKAQLKQELGDLRRQDGELQSRLRPGGGVPWRGGPPGPAGGGPRDMSPREFDRGRRGSMDSVGSRESMGSRDGRARITSPPDHDDRGRKRGREEDNGGPQAKAGRTSSSEGAPKRTSSLKADEGAKKRNSRMFGMLLGTLRGAKKEVSKLQESSSAKKQQEALEKADQALAHQRDEARDEARNAQRKRRAEDVEARQKLQAEQRAKHTQLEELEVEERFAQLSSFIRTTSQPAIMFRPAKHNDSTRQALELSKQALAAEMEQQKVLVRKSREKLWAGRSGPGERNEQEDSNGARRITDERRARTRTEADDMDDGEEEEDLSQKDPVVETEEQVSAATDEDQMDEDQKDDTHTAASVSKKETPAEAGAEEANMETAHHASDNEPTSNKQGEGEAAAAKKKTEDEVAAVKKKAEDEAAAAKKKAEDEAAAAKKKTEDEAAAAKKKAEDEAAAAKNTEEEAAAAKKKAEDEAAAAKKTEEEAAAASEAVAAGNSEELGPLPPVKELKRKKKGDLVALAEARGVSSSGTKDAIIARLVT